MRHAKTNQIPVGIDHRAAVNGLDRIANGRSK